MKLRIAVLAIAAHIAASALSMALLFAILPGSGSVLENIATGLSQPFAYLWRWPHGLYILYAMLCVLLVPVRAGLADARQLRTAVPRSASSGLGWILATAVLVPLIYGFGAEVMGLWLARGMTIYGATMAHRALPFGLAAWALVSVPITWATSSLIRRRFASAEQAKAQA